MSAGGQVAAYLDAAAYHERKVATIQRALARSEAWSRANNDGEWIKDGDSERATLALPLHKASAREFRRRAARASRSGASE